MARVYGTVFAATTGAHTDGLRLVLLWLGVVTALVGAVMCSRQRHLKRLLIQAAAARFLDFNRYGAAVLDARPTGPAFICGDPAHATTSSLVFGFGAALDAGGFAALALFRDHLPPAFNRNAKRFVDPPLSWLGQLHSGQVCDYAAWLTAGMAALGILFFAALRS